MPDAVRPPPVHPVLVGHYEPGPETFPELPASFRVKNSNTIKINQLTLKTSNMINALDLSKLRNGEYSQLIIDVLAIVSQNDPGAMKVGDAFAALSARSAEVEALFKIPTGSTITAELEALD